MLRVDQLTRVCRCVENSLACLYFDILYPETRIEFRDKSAKSVTQCHLGGYLLMAYILLILAIISEVFGSTMLKVSDGFSKIFPTLGVAAGYGICFYFLSLALLELPLGFSYAIWSGAGTIFTAFVGILLFKEKINRKGTLGISLVLIGIVLLNLTK